MRLFFIIPFFFLSSCEKHNSEEKPVSIKENLVPTEKITSTEKTPDTKGLFELVNNVNKEKKSSVPSKRYVVGVEGEVRIIKKNKSDN